MQQRRPVNIGHRGHELKPENTIESFLDAIDCGAEMIELDVWLSADGVPVVYHDEFLVSQGQNLGRIAEHSAVALSQIQLPGGARIPVLKDVLSEILPKAPVNIELKFFNLNYRPMVGALLQLLSKIKAEKKVLISSFFHQSLEIVNRAEPTIATAPIFGVPTGPPHKHDLEKLTSLGPWRKQVGFDQPAAVIDYLMLDDDLLSDFRASQIAVVAYTVNEPEDMRRMTELGVHGIITKRPSVLREVLSSRPV